MGFAVLQPGLVRTAKNNIAPPELGRFSKIGNETGAAKKGAELL
jgi:hypothetical protein